MAPATDPLKGDSARAVGALARLTLADLLRTRRALLAAAVLALPVAFSLYWSLAETITGDALDVWGKTVVLLYLNVAAPLVALLVGATLVSAERESQTLVYLLTRPVPRWKIALTQYLTGGALCLAGVAASMALSLAALALHARSGPAAEIFGWAEALSYWPRLAGVAAAALVVYFSLFFLAGVVMRRPIALGVVFIVAWEGFVGASDKLLRFGTVIYYVRSLAIHATRGVLEHPSLIMVKETTVGAALAVLASIAAASLALALWHFSRAEYPTMSDR